MAIGIALLAIVAVIVGWAGVCVGAAAFGFLVIVVPGYILLWLLGAVH
jgi:hypothetical protein